MHRLPEIWKELRESGCPVAHSDRYGGMWAPMTHEFVKEVAYDTCFEVAREEGWLGIPLVCRACGHHVSTWMDSCPNCGETGTLSLALS